MQRILRIILALITPLASKAQSPDLSGRWTGLLQQDHKVWSFVVSMELTQQNAVLSGTIKSLAPDGSYSLIRIEGSINGDSVNFRDAGIVDENISTGMQRLCIKNYHGSLKAEGNKITITGSWENNGTRSYANGMYYETNFVCFPGIFNLEKTTADIPPPVSANKESNVQSDVFLDRKIEIQKHLDVFSDSLNLVFYDNGIVDDDTISVFLNKIPVISKQRLTVNPLSVTVKLKPGTDNEIIMFAENMGTIPPNTALLVFSDSGQRYELTIDSDTGKSGTIILRRKKL